MKRPGASPAFVIFLLPLPPAVPLRRQATDSVVARNDARDIGVLAARLSRHSLAAPLFGFFAAHDLLFLLLSPRPLAFAFPSSEWSSCRHSVATRGYQRGSRRPPPPPPPPRLPPKPPPPPRLPPKPPPPPGPRGSFGRASFTVSVRPPSCDSCSSVIAFCAPSSVAISTNPKPRARPVAMSRMTVTDSTGPTRSNNS